MYESQVLLVSLLDTNLFLSYSECGEYSVEGWKEIRRSHVVEVSEDGHYPSAFYLKCASKICTWVRWLKPKSPVSNRIVTSTVAGQSLWHILQASGGFWFLWPGGVLVQKICPVASETNVTSQVCFKDLSKETHRVTSSEKCHLWTCHVLASFNVPWFLSWKIHWTVLFQFSCYCLINYCNISAISCSRLRSPSVLTVPRLICSMCLKLLLVLLSNFPIYILFVIKGIGSTEYCRCGCSVNLY